MADLTITFPDTCDAEASSAFLDKIEEQGIAPGNRAFTTWLEEVMEREGAFSTGEMDASTAIGEQCDALDDILFAAEEALRNGDVKAAREWLGLARDKIGDMV